MTNNGMIRNGKLQHNLNRQDAKIAALLSSKLEKY